MHKNFICRHDRHSLMRTAFFSLFVSLLVSLSATTAWAASSWFEHATLIDATSPTARTGMAIQVVDGRIAAVLPDAEVAQKIQPDDIRIDLSGRYLIPGLIDTHVHLATDANMARAHAQLQLYLYSGITTVRDMAGDARLLAELRRELLLQEVPGPTLHYAALMAGESFFNDPRTHQASAGETAGQIPWMQAITDKTDADRAVAMAIGTYASGIKLYANMPASDVARIAKAANEVGMPIWTHGAVFPAKPSELVDAGVRRLSHLYMLGYEVAEDFRNTSYGKRPEVDFATLSVDHPRLQKLIASLKQQQVMIDATLYVIDYAASNDRIPAEARVGLADKFEFSLRLAKAMLAAGIPMSTGSDVFVGKEFGQPGLWPELLAWQQRAGIDPHAILTAATLNGARTLGIENDVGTLEVGKRANFVILTENPLTDIAAITRLEATVQNGKRYPRSEYKLTEEIWQSLRE